MKIDDVIKANIISSQIRAVVNIRYTSNYISAIQNNFMSRYDITMPQFNILRILRGAKNAISVNTVKERMVERSPNTTRLMDKLIDKGLIERERCEDDKRIIFVKIAKKGLKLLEEIDACLEAEKILPQNLTDEEAEQLSALLDKLRG